MLSFGDLGVLVLELHHIPGVLSVIRYLLTFL